VVCLCVGEDKFYSAVGFSHSSCYITSKFLVDHDVILLFEIFNENSQTICLVMVLVCCGCSVSW
jgi:hypothetical protein